MFKRIINSKFQKSKTDEQCSKTLNHRTDKINVLGTAYKIEYVDENHDCWAKRGHQGEVNCQFKTITVVEKSDLTKDEFEYYNTLVLSSIKVTFLKQ